jgi:hypothetical protein
MLAAFLLILAIPLQADVFPLYEHFYPCDSGVMNCAAFSKHWYGDFGLTGLKPCDVGYELVEGMFPFASNSRGEVIGSASPEGTYAPVYGVNGVVYCIAGCPDNSGSILPVDINNHGYYLFSYYNSIILLGHSSIRHGSEEALGFKELLSRHTSGGIQQTLGSRRPESMTTTISLLGSGTTRTTKQCWVCSHHTQSQNPARSRF